VKQEKPLEGTPKAGGGGREKKKTKRTRQLYKSNILQKARGAMWGDKKSGFFVSNLCYQWGGHSAQVETGRRGLG